MQLLYSLLYVWSLVKEIICAKLVKFIQPTRISFKL